jgi:hypothetical protein
MAGTRPAMTDGEVLADGEAATGEEVVADGVVADGVVMGTKLIRH